MLVSLQPERVVARLGPQPRAHMRKSQKSFGRSSHISQSFSLVPCPQTREKNSFHLSASRPPILCLLFHGCLPSPSVSEEIFSLLSTAGNNHRREHPARSFYRGTNDYYHLPIILLTASQRAAGRSSFSPLQERLIRSSATQGQAIESNDLIGGDRRSHLSGRQASLTAASPHEPQPHLRTRAHRRLTPILILKMLRAVRPPP